MIPAAGNLLGLARLLAVEEEMAMASEPSKRSVTRRAFLEMAIVSTGFGVARARGPSAHAAQTPPGPQAPPFATPSALLAQAPAAPRTAGPKKGGTFTLANTATGQEFYPLYTLAGHYPYMRALFNTLARYDAHLDLQPELAEKWDVSPDGRALTLKLRQGVKFHSGREFTSEDVKFTAEFAREDAKTTMRAAFRLIAKVETPDRYTAVLKFDAINVGIFDLMDSFFVIDKESIEKRANFAVGTGPFRFERYIPNQQVEMVAFKDYWEKGKPYLDKYILRVIPDSSALSINLESGAVDAILRPSYVDLVRLRDSRKFAADLGAPGVAIYNLAINVKAEPFTDKRVRQAIAWSIDRARFARTILQGLVEPTCLMWPAHSWAYFKDLEGKIGFDLEKARSLLKQAGLEKGFDTEILASTKLSFGLGDLAQLMQADIKKIGINAKVLDVEAAQYQARFNKQDIVMMAHNYSRANRDPGTLVTGAVAWFNDKERGWTRFESAEYDRLRQELQSTLDQTKRKAICRRIQEIALDECFVNPVAPNARAWAYASSVKDFSYDLENAPILTDVWLDK